MAGITAYVAAQMREEPILGLWKSSFSQDLAWLRISKEPKEAFFPLRGVLPLWSWLACPGTAEYDLWRWDSWNRVGLEQEKIDHVELLEWDVQWDGAPYVSAVKSAHVRVVGSTREIEMTPFKEGAVSNPSHFQVFGEDLNFSQKTSIPRRCAGQFGSKTVTESATYLCLLLHSRTSITDRGTQFDEIFLVLESVGARGDREVSTCGFGNDNGIVADVRHDDKKVYVIVFFYETLQLGLTYDAYLYHKDALTRTVTQCKASKIGVLSVFPFSAFAWARLDAGFANDPPWNAKIAAKHDGYNPTSLTPKQPIIEMFNIGCYGRPLDFTDFPINGERVFAMVTLLWNAHSIGTVTICSADPTAIPIVDSQYLSDEDGLDLLVLSEECRYSNNIVVHWKGTKDIVKGSWPWGLQHHTWTESEGALG